jgi:ribulose-phosphate 3-epimerase
VNDVSLIHQRQIAPSILSADFARLGRQVEEVMAAGARVIHVDVTDGHFVPPITLGVPVVSGLADQIHAAGGVIDVHLMIERPERHVREYAQAGADSITIHVEATPHLHYTLGLIREAGCTAGAALCPATPPSTLQEVAEESLDLALCMSVNPGWSGQRFIPSSLGKLSRMRAELPDHVSLEVDGGINGDTVAPASQAGANLLVAASAVFDADDPAAAYSALVERMRASGQT